MLPSKYNLGRESNRHRNSKEPVVFCVLTLVTSEATIRNLVHYIQTQYEGKCAMSVPGDTCDTCNTPYKVTPKNAKLFCFLEYPRANHIEVLCPNGHSEDIFIGFDAFLHVIKECRLRVTFAGSPSKAFRQIADEAYDGPKAPKEVDVPHYLLRELYDQMRHYEATN